MRVPRLFPLRRTASASCRARRTRRLRGSARCRAGVRGTSERDRNDRERAGEFATTASMRAGNSSSAACATARRRVQRATGTAIATPIAKPAVHERDLERTRRRAAARAAIRCRGAPSSGARRRGSRRETPRVPTGRGAPRERRGGDRVGERARRPSERARRRRASRQRPRSEPPSRSATSAAAEGEEGVHGETLCGRAPTPPRREPPCAASRSTPARLAAMPEKRYS